jgi:PEP-CTERM motif
MKMKLLALSLVLLCSSAANAIPIVYTVSEDATGTLGKTSFTNEILTLSFAADTSNVIQVVPGFFSNNMGVGTIFLNGVDVATFTETVRFFDAQGVSVAGIGSVPQLTSILQTTNSVFSSYSGLTSIGPVSGNAFSTLSDNFSTTAGVLNISSISGSSTFTAVATSVPEPSTLAFFATGVLGAAGMVRRRLLSDKNSSTK